MLTGLLRYLWNIVRERAGSLLGLVRKALNAIRSLFGSARGLLKPLIKKVLSFVVGKFSTARTRAQSSLESLKRRAEAYLKREPPEQEIAVDEDEATSEQQVTASFDESVAPECEATAAAELDSDGADAQEPEEATPAPSSDTADANEAAEAAAKSGPRRRGSTASTGASESSSTVARAELALLAPVLRRALVRTLGRGRAARADRSARMFPAS